METLIQTQSFPVFGVLLHAHWWVWQQRASISHTKRCSTGPGRIIGWSVALSVGSLRHGCWHCSSFLQTPVILSLAPVKSILWTAFFGAVWGVGGLTFGLTMRYLGVALGYAIALGLTAVFGTLIPPLFSGELFDIATTPSRPGLAFRCVLVCVIGIVLGGMAGRRKEAELSDEQKQETIAEFNFAKGLTFAIVAGIMSASMAVAFVAGKPIAQLAVDHGAPVLWQNLPVLIVILFGGFITNFVWCVALIVKNGTWVEFARQTDGKQGNCSTFEQTPFIAEFPFLAQSLV